VGALRLQSHAGPGRDSDRGRRGLVSRPLDQPFDRALAGRYPPGSTFKIVTAEALLTQGTTPDTQVQCSPEATVGGKRFTDFEGEALGAIPFGAAFAMSCNTAFVTAASRLPSGALAEAAESFGFGARYTLPLASSPLSPDLLCQFALLTMQVWVMSPP
jgi:cell division protein FtsI/penicillin-binding protein 2